MIITALCDTWLKPSVEDSSTIVKGQMQFFGIGTSYEAIKMGPLVKGHYLLTLDHAVGGYTEWYVFSSDVRVEGASTGVNLKVPYYPQYDNKYEPYTSCFATSVAMALAFHGVKPSSSLTLEDELFLYLSDNNLDRFSWQDMVYLVGKYGCNAIINHSGSFSLIMASLEAGNPVVLGTYFTHAGHIVLVKGYDADGLICNDPWGVALGAGQYDKDRPGNDVHYSWSFIAQNASDVGGSDPSDLWIMYVGRA